MNESLESQSKNLLKVADELEMAAKHARIAADHFKTGEVPRGCAHTLATDGHISSANDLIKAVAIAHAAKAVLP